MVALDASSVDIGVMDVLQRKILHGFWATSVIFVCASFFGPNSSAKRRCVLQSDSVNVIVWSALARTISIRPVKYIITEGIYSLN